ncbi:hypothetical protein QBC35DRAFT_384463 [Podospora australis]|uniref:Ysc84 actin-binding domain-containing protein n=1 Tax=Podospora australis TaxID=1536484 RepID=A0AAN6WUS8_9PEZI|nr:hypothetical protein QBC35DRAFT_384463 [Podospora australis]
MSAPEKKTPLDPTQPQYFPPPPPGPPPLQTEQAAAPQASQTTVPTPAPAAQGRPKHTNETPLDDFYNATPIDEHPPQFPPATAAAAAAADGQHSSGDEGGKKKSKFMSSFKGYYQKATDSLTTHVGPAVNAMARKTGAEGFIAESLDKECEKAARILRAFCKDGIYVDQPQQQAPPTPTPTPTPSSKPDGKPVDPAKAKKSKALLTIPPKVIAKAQGLAIFTAFRAGFQGTVTGGSGILISRRPDGSWSPPSGIRVGGLGAGFVIGAEIYDCVVVINTKEALDLFTKPRLSLGSDLAVTAGPFGAGGSLDWGIPAGTKGREKDKNNTDTPNKPESPPLSSDNTHFQTAPVTPGEITDPLEDPTKGKKPSLVMDAIKKPVYSYVKSHGVYAGVQISGTVIIARDNANAKFYGRPVTVGEILDGKVEAPAAARNLFEVLKGASGWRGQGTSPVSPSFPPSVAGAPPPTFAPPSTTTTGTAPTFAPPPTVAVDTIASGVKDLDIGEGSASASTSYPPPPPGPPPTTTANAKAAEAAAESARANASSPPPPVYSEYSAPPPPSGAPAGGSGGEDLPPAYVEEDGQRRPVDSKTGLH